MFYLTTPTAIPLGINEVMSKARRHYKLQKARGLGLDAQYLALHQRDLVAKTQ